MLKFKKIINENPDRVSTTVWWGQQDARTFGYINNKFFISKEATNHPDYFVDLLNKKLISKADFPNGPPTTAHRSNFQFPGRLWINEKIISFWVFPDKMSFGKLIDDVKKNGITIDDSWKVDIKEGTNYNKEELVPITEYTDKFKNIKVKSVDHIVSPMLKKKDTSIKPGSTKKKLAPGMTFAKYRSMKSTSESVNEEISTVAPTSVATGQHPEKVGPVAKRGESDIKEKIKKKLKDKKNARKEASVPKP